MMEGKKVRKRSPRMPVFGQQGDHASAFQALEEMVKFESFPSGKKPGPGSLAKGSRPPPPWIRAV